METGKENQRPKKENNQPKKENNQLKKENNQLKKALNEMQLQLKTITAKNEEQELQLVDQQTTLEEKQNVIDDRHASIKNLCEDLDKNKGLLKQATTHIEALECRNLDLATQLYEVKETMRAEKTNSEHEKEQLVRVKADLEQQVQDLRDKLERRTGETQPKTFMDTAAEPTTEGPRTEASPINIQNTNNYGNTQMGDGNSMTVNHYNGDTSGGRGSEGRQGEGDEEDFEYVRGSDPDETMPKSLLADPDQTLPKTLLTDGESAKPKRRKKWLKRWSTYTRCWRIGRRQKKKSLERSLSSASLSGPDA